MPTTIFQRGVFPDASYTGTQDTRIWSQNPNTTYHSATDLNIAVNHTTLGDGRILFRFDLSAIPPSATVSEAALELYLAQLVSGSGLESLEVSALTESWAELEACWANRAAGQAWSTPGGALGSLLGTVSGNSTGTKTLNTAALRDAVQGWVSDPASNCGLLVKAPDADEASTPYTNMLFRPGEFATPAQRPKLTVTYTVPIGTPSLLLVSRTTTSLTFQVAHGAEGEHPVAGTRLYLTSDPATPVADCPAGESEAAVSGLVPGSNYHVVAKSYDNQEPPNWSAASAEVAASTPGGSSLPEEVCEVWGDLDAWEGSENLEVSGNRVYAKTDGIAGNGSRAVSGSSVWRLDADIVVSKSGNCWVGVNLWHTPSHSNLLVAVGYSLANGGLGLYDGSRWINLLSAASITAGQSFHVQLVADGSGVSATAFHANGLNEYHAGFPAPACYTVTSLLVRSEYRADTIAKLGCRKGLGPYQDATFDHLMVISTACPEGHPIRFRLPPGYRSSVSGHKTAMLCHASGQYLWTFWETTTPPRKQLHDALLADGWVLMLPEADYRHWGNEEMLRDVALAYTYAQTVLGCERQITAFASSMGGLMAWLSVMEHPHWFRGIAAVYPVCDLDDMYDGGIRGGENFQSYINAAYGIEASSSSDPAYQAATEGHNPMDRPYALQRCPAMIWHGDQDATVPLAAHSMPFRDAVNALGGDVTLIPVPGAGHGALGPSCWDIPGILAFLNGCRYRGWASRLDRLLVRRGRR